MSSEPNFIDVVALTRITPQTYVENFGSAINSSFFDASNILGTLRMKKLVDFETNFPGQNEIKITETGNKLLQDLSAKAESEFDHLDMEIIEQLSKGKRSLPDISGAINIAETDMAMHLYKLSKQGFATYEIRNGVIAISLTEKGFMRAKEGMPQKAQAQAAAPQPGATIPAQANPLQAGKAEAQQMGDVLQQSGAKEARPQMPGGEYDEKEAQELQKMAPRKSGMKKPAILILLAIIIIILVVLLIKSL
ncbi:MAG: hypothetical protein M1279_00615 [Candidatus Marsarchaeota archaeon]|jgi:hypothetical protein|nr:hypothetical protein [Candidatus Marsarchaeota archaeon]